MFLKIATGVGIVVFGMRGIYTSWFPHTLSSFVHTSGNWTEGERRSCTLTRTRKVYQLDCTVTLSEEDRDKSKSNIQVMIHQIGTTDCHNVGLAFVEGILFRAASTTNRRGIEPNGASQAVMPLTPKHQAVREFLSGHQ